MTSTEHVIGWYSAGWWSASRRWLRSCGRADLPEFDGNARLGASEGAAHDVHPFRPDTGSGDYRFTAQAH